MNRHLLFALLLTTGVALATNNAGAAQAQAKAKETQAQTKKPFDKSSQGKPAAKTELAQGRTQHAQAKTEAQAKRAETKTEVAQLPAEPAQATTEEAKQPANGDAKKEEEAKLQSVPGSKALGMSILGNQEAPKALVIVPWKSSELGRSPALSAILDDSRQPVDKEVFMRALRYYEIRETAQPGAPTTNSAQSVTAAQRRKQ